MDPNPSLIYLDDLAHRLLSTHRLPESAKNSGHYPAICKKYRFIGPSTGVKIAYSSGYNEFYYIVDAIQ